MTGEQKTLFRFYMKKTRTIYRDGKTGRFASRSTWKRSRAHGGIRYRRGKLKIPKRQRARRIARTVRPAARPIKDLRSIKSILQALESEADIDQEEEEEEVETGIDYGEADIGEEEEEEG